MITDDDASKLCDLFDKAINASARLIEAQLASVTACSEFRKFAWKLSQPKEESK